MNNHLEDLVLKLMAIDSTTSKEHQLANYLATNLKPQGAKLKVQQVTKQQKNLYFEWGKPKIIFCTHLDTVPPYIAPYKKNGVIYGRGACDAKGQIVALYETCQQLYREGQNNFGLLLVCDEEKKSRGAKVANQLIKECKYVIIGEPTNNRLITAGKGVALFEVTISGKAAHSGYPEHGEDAIESFRVFLNKLAKLKLPPDKLLGKTTYNISQIRAVNPANVVPNKVTCRVLFRTTFTTHNSIAEKIQKLATNNIKIQASHSNPPISFMTVRGFKTGTVAFGSDAPSLNKLGIRLLYGPGDILNAHTAHEKIKVSELNRAVNDLKKLYYKLANLNYPL